MQFIIEDNIDFLNALNSTDDSEDISKCLISNMPLENNYITLNCKHQFNYESLFEEIRNQKKINYMETKRVSHSQMKCPYCRTITNKILPYFASYNHQLIYGVNSPERYALSIYECEYVFKSGTQKNNTCCKSACKSGFGIFCNSHYKMMEKKKNKENNKENKKISKKESNNNRKRQNQNKLSLQIKGSEPIINLPEVGIELVENTIVETFQNLDEASYKNKSIVELKNILRLNGCKVSGRKQELIDRILLYKIKKGTMWIKHE